MIIVNIILSSAWHHCYRNHAPTLALASLPQRPRAYYIGCTWYLVAANLVHHHEVWSSLNHQCHSSAMHLVVVLLLLLVGSRSSSGGSGSVIAKHNKRTKQAKHTTIKQHDNSNSGSVIPKVLHCSNRYRKATARAFVIASAGTKTSGELHTAHL